MTAKEIKKIYNLKSTPSCVTSDLNCAKFYKNERSAIIHGTDGNFWVVAGGDAKTLRNLGLEQA